MKFGITMFTTDTAMRPSDLAREVEVRGFESLWFPEHSHIPTSRKTPMGGVKGAPPLPQHYWHTLDQFVALGAALAVTTRLRVATGITLVAQRDAIWLAKEVATVDHLSDGRMIFGIGYGWNKEEMESHGVRYQERRAILAEKIRAMKALWSDEQPSFRGRYVNFEPSWAWPKPVQRPHPPIILGAAAGPKTIDDLIAFCDGWIPLGTRHQIEGKVGEVRRALEAAGRDSRAFEVSVFYAEPDALPKLAAWGVDRAVFRVPPAPADVVIPHLNELAKVAAEFSRQ